MKKQNIIITAIIVLVLVSGAFYGGMQYGASKAAKAQVAQGGRNAGNFGGGANGGQRGGAPGQGGQRGNGAGFVAGEVIAKDDTSVTIKIADGSSKIVFFSGTTSIDKSVAGASSDLSVGQQITVNGKTGTDGSLTAQNIQIRPTQPVGAAK